MLIINVFKIFSLPLPKKETESRKTMKRISLIVVLMLAMTTITATAQKRKTTVKKKVVHVEQKAPEDPKIVQMLSATQKIMFIDSVVVNKDAFLTRMHLNPETGTLAKAADFFGKKGYQDGTVYQNELGNKCYFSHSGKLYTSDLLEGEWSKPTLLDGLDSDGQTNYPFMMTDGTTFYFASTSTEGLGGYDIYMTRFDSGTGKFLKPENIGMPFNSEANDYMFVIDEISNIGYFVTDRRQPEGKVCVYIFIPPTSRRTYPLDNLSDEQLRAYAEIRRIASTWGNGKERKQALERLKTITPNTVTQQPKSELEFIINDQVTYTSIDQFRSPESLPLYRQLNDAQKRLTEIKNNLEKSRAYYAKANKEDKWVLRTEITDGEDEIMRLSSEVRILKKKIRNAENRIINAPK